MTTRSRGNRTPMDAPKAQADLIDRMLDQAAAKPMSKVTIKAKAVRSRGDGYATLWDTAGDQVGYVWKEEFIGASVWRLALYGPTRERKVLARFRTRKAAVEFAERVINRPEPKPLTEEEKANLRKVSEDIRRAFGGI